MATPASVHNSDHEELTFGFKEKRLWDLSLKLFVLLANRKMFYGHPFIQKKWNIQGWLVHLSSEWKDMLDKVEEEGGRQNIQRCFRGATQLQDSCHHLGWTLEYNQRSLYFDRILCIVAAGRGANWQLTDKLASEELCWPAHYLSLFSRVHI